MFLFLVSLMQFGFCARKQGQTAAQNAIVTQDAKATSDQASQQPAPQTVQPDQVQQSAQSAPQVQPQPAPQALDQVQQQEPAQQLPALQPPVMVPAVQPVPDVPKSQQIDVPEQQLPKSLPPQPITQPVAQPQPAPQQAAAHPLQPAQQKDQIQTDQSNNPMVGEYTGVEAEVNEAEEEVKKTGENIKEAGDAIAQIAEVAEAAKKPVKTLSNLFGGWFSSQKLKKVLQQDKILHQKHYVHPHKDQTRTHKLTIFLYLDYNFQNETIKK